MADEKNDIPQPRGGCAWWVLALLILCLTGQRCQLQQTCADRCEDGYRATMFECECLP